MDKFKKVIIVILIIAILCGIGYGLYRLCLFFRPAPTVNAEHIYTITFDANGGRFMDDTTEKTVQTDKNGKLESFPVAQRYEYTLTGWFTDKFSDTEFKVSSITPNTVFTSDTVLYANWYKFDGDGGDGDGNGNGKDPDEPDDPEPTPKPDPVPTPDPPTPSKHICESKCKTCGNCIDFACKDKVCSVKCTGHDEEHYCQHECAICGRCLSNCTEKYCASKCMGHDRHECESKCSICGKCTNKSCNGDNCKIKCNGHEHKCQSNCPECGKCTNANCTEPACQDKCTGHELHTCTSACETCGKCTDMTCNKTACKDKCNGHAEEHKCLHVCPICDQCSNFYCLEENCSEKCYCNDSFGQGNLPPMDIDESEFKESGEYILDEDGYPIAYSCGCTHIEDDGCQCGYGYACEYSNCDCSCHDRITLEDVEFYGLGVTPVFYNSYTSLVEYVCNLGNNRFYNRISIVYPGKDICDLLLPVLVLDDEGKFKIVFGGGSNCTYSVTGVKIIASKGLRYPVILSESYGYGVCSFVEFYAPEEFWLDASTYYLIYPQIEMYDPVAGVKASLPDFFSFVPYEDEQIDPSLLSQCKVIDLGYTKSGDHKALITVPTSCSIIELNRNGNVIDPYNSEIDFDYSVNPTMIFMEFAPFVRGVGEVKVFVRQDPGAVLELSVDSDMFVFWLDGICTIYGRMYAIDGTPRVYVNFIATDPNAEFVDFILYYGEYPTDDELEPTPIDELAFNVELHIFGRYAYLYFETDEGFYSFDGGMTIRPVFKNQQQ